MKLAAIITLRLVISEKLVVDKEVEPNILDLSTIDTSTFVLVTNISLNPDVSYDLIKTVYLMLDDTDQHFLKQFDLTPVQFYALLWLEGAERKSLSQLSRDLLCDPSNVTRLADTLERKGHVLRQRDPNDRRVTWVALTPAGAELCQKARREHARFTRARMNTLSEAEQASLEKLLTKLRDGLNQHLQAA